MEQGKLVGVLSGEIFDVAVDIRKESPFYGNWISVKLSFANNNYYGYRQDLRMVFIL